VAGSLVPLESGRSRCAGDGDHDDRGDDAVVEAALDGDHLTDPGGDDRVGHHGDAEGGVRRREGSADEESQPQAQLRPEPGGQRPAEQHGERQPDAEQAEVPPDIAAQLPDRQPGGIGEEHPDERDLDEHDERPRLLGTFHQAGPRECGTDGDEEDGGRQVGACEPLREHTPAEECRGDDDDRGGFHRRAFREGRTALR
jgi:hypothetical protein